MASIFRDNIYRLIKNLESIHSQHELAIEAAVRLSAGVITGGNKLFLCGNGGSAATASHVANDLLCHMKNWARKGYAAICLNDSAAAITSLTNDFGFEHIFEKMLAALAKRGDALWAFSTSGNSSNVIKAMNTAKELGMQTVAFTGAHGGKMKALADVWLPAPSDEVMRVEELHMVFAHCVAESVEAIASPIEGQ